MKPIVERLAEVEARFKDTSVCDADKAKYYLTDLATLFEANQMLLALTTKQTAEAKVFLTRIEQLCDPSAHLRREIVGRLLIGWLPIPQSIDLGREASDVRRGINPTTVIAAGVPSADEITGRPPFKPRIVK